ncbi:MAG: translesion DNA synthesis-associated protein ImuA [Pseudomonadales bacterium]
MSQESSSNTFLKPQTSQNGIQHQHQHQHQHKSTPSKLGALTTLLTTTSLWRANQHPVQPAQQSTVSSEHPRLDQVLPNGGWPINGITELLLSHNGLGELQLLTPALATLSQRQPGWLAFISPPYLPYAPSLKSAGLQIEDILVIQPKTATEALWAAEQCLLSEACSAVLMWPQKSIRPQSIRRLQIASKQTQTWHVLFRSADSQNTPSPAPLRILLEPGTSTVNNKSLQHSLRIEVLKRAGGWASAPIELEIPLSAELIYVQHQFDGNSRLQDALTPKATATVIHPLPASRSSNTPEPPVELSRGL